MKVWRYGGVQYPSLHTRFFAPKSTDVTIIVRKRAICVSGEFDALAMCRSIADVRTAKVLCENSTLFAKNFARAN